MGTGWKAPKFEIEQDDTSFLDQYRSWYPPSTRSRSSRSSHSTHSVSSQNTNRSQKSQNKMKRKKLRRRQSDHKFSRKSDRNSATSGRSGYGRWNSSVPSTSMRTSHSESHMEGMVFIHDYDRELVHTHVQSPITPAGPRSQRAVRPRTARRS